MKSLNQLVNYSSLNNIKLHPASPIKPQTQERIVWNKGRNTGVRRPPKIPPKKEKGRGKARQGKAHKAFHFTSHFYFPFSICYLRTLPSFTLPSWLYSMSPMGRCGECLMDAWWMPDFFASPSPPPLSFSLFWFFRLGVFAQCTREASPRGGPPWVVS
jgi:hypothetical protein